MADGTGHQARALRAPAEAETANRACALEPDSLGRDERPLLKAIERLLGYTVAIRQPDGYVQPAPRPAENQSQPRARQPANGGHAHAHRGQHSRRDGGRRHGGRNQGHGSRSAGRAQGRGR